MDAFQDEIWLLYWWKRQFLMLEIDWITGQVYVSNLL
jgi:hypothetical protein